MIAELDRNGIAYSWAGEDEVRVRCPFHSDDSPSCGVNVAKRVFRCPVAGCERSGDVIDLLAGYLRASRSVVEIDLYRRYGACDDATVEASVVERWHGDIWLPTPLAKAMRYELYKRGVTDALIRKQRYGLDEKTERVTIPVRNQFGLFVNVRKYKPGAAGSDKFKNLRGRGKPRWYPVEQLKYDTILFCGGELKAAVAAEQLNPHNVGAISVTAGEGNFPLELVGDLRDKRVMVCLDVDSAGRLASLLRCKQFRPVAESVRLIELPLDLKTHPKGDINDFVAAGGDMWELVERSLAGPEWEDVGDGLKWDEEPVDTSLVQATIADSAGRRVRFTAVVTTMDTAPYIVPRRGSVECDRGQVMCGACKIYSAPDGRFDVHPEHDAILEMIAAGKNSVREGLMRATGVPRTCPVADFNVSEYFNADDARIGPQLEVTNRAVERVMQPAVCIGTKLELNESYRFVGRMWPHPKTQQSTLLVSSYEPTQDALTSYRPDDLYRLEVFRPVDWSVDGLRARLLAIYDDLEANVTNIYKRRDLHLAVDLAYHSPLVLKFDNRTVNGWTQILVVGDTAQGKSEVSCGATGNGGLMRHYGVGEKVDVGNATVAGLLGGCQRSGDRYFVTWGVIPTHDKRLVVIEELKGANPEVICKLRDMRSSGVAEIPKIDRRRTHARTRLLVLSNPPSDHGMRVYDHGVKAVKDLVGHAEDVRRFDMALIMNKSEIDPAELNYLREHRPAVEHRYTSSLCHALVLWAWTRTDDQVEFEPDATRLILASATKLCERLTDDIPLLDRGSARYKLARLSAALAGRTFSCDETMQRLIVRECHAQYVADYLERVYTSSVSGYADYTLSVTTRDTLVDPRIVKKQIEGTPYPRDLVKHMLSADRFDSQDVRDWCGWDRLSAEDLVSFLVRKHAVTREGRGYRKTPDFIALLKELRDSDKLVDRPSFMKDEF